MNKKFLYIYTIGCQMNVYDSEMFERVLQPLDYIPVSKVEDADLVIVNTCSVRKKAEEKAFSFLGTLQDLKGKNPELIIAVGGCVAQQEGRKIVNRMPYVDIVFGTKAVGRLPELVEKFERERVRIVDVNMDTEIGEFVPVDQNGGSGSVSRFVTIMRGCDNFCTYCIVPYVRGREASRTPESIVREIENLVKSGMKEVTLLGQNVNSYGLKEGLCSFPMLLRKISEIEGLERIRFATSHPKDLSDELILAYRDLDKLCNHIHLPVQSGSNRLLKRMNRKYTRETYMERVRRLREVRPDIALSSDMIVGFPGETDEDFRETLDLVRRVGFDGLFAFKYSDRPNAPAVSFSDKVSEKVKSQRLDELLRLEKELSAQKNGKYVGRTEEVLVEGVSKKQGANGAVSWTGRTSSNKVVNFCREGAPASKNGEMAGRLVDVYIEKGHPHSLWGVLKTE